MKDEAAKKRYLDSVKASQAKRMQWWHDARFGMFIHWGLYAVPAGEWQGKECPCIGEWIMSQFRIPVAEYEKLAGQFNPTRFDADAWVRLAKDAGMKYLVITAKHHDGFAMYRSKASAYNIVDATPFLRDPLKELSAACAKHGVRFCVYYSQALDWHEADAGGTEPDARPTPDGNSWGNDWDFPDHSKKDFARFFEGKVKPQVRELLTGYGPIGLVWFDCPATITREQCRELADLVHSLQPDCLVSGRIGGGAGDYNSLGDNEAPGQNLAGNWESLATMNDTWGYKKNDHNWKSSADLLTLLIENAAKGSNLLLNVGPTAEGLIPEASVERLKEMGAWLRVNGEAIYGTGPSPYPYDFEWGRITRAPGALFLHLQRWPADGVALCGLRNRVRRATLLADRRRRIQIVQEHDTAADAHWLRLRIPGARPAEPISVIRLDLEGEADVDGAPTQIPGEVLSLPAHLGAITAPEDGSRPWVAVGGATENWLTAAPSITWDLKFGQAGEFAVELLLRSPHWGKPVEEGHRVSVSVAGQSIRSEVRATAKRDTVQSRCYPEIAARIGIVSVPAPGRLRLTLKADAIAPDVRMGLAVAAVRLIPCKEQRSLPPRLPWRAAV